MNCEQAQESISAALDGELSPAEQAALSEHLLRCGECRALAEELRSLSEALDASDQAPPPELSRRVMEAAAAEKRTVPISSKKRLLPWLRTAAAMLALCVCLGGAKLWLSRNTASLESNLSGGATPYSAGSPVPSAAADGAEQSADARSMEDKLIFSESPETPAADEGNVLAPACVEPEAGAESITPEEALELVFEYLGGYETYPEARLRINTGYGFDTPAYYLKTAETDFDSYEYCLDYVGLSANGRCYQFRLYEDVTGSRPDGFDHTATSNWFAVSLDGTELLPQFPPDGGDDELWQAYASAYESALAG